MVQVAPSLLSADLSKLEAEIKKVEGADYLHLDVMDGHFVPNITFGPIVVKACRKLTKLPLDVHLMIENPHKYIKNFVEAGSDIVAIQAEASRELKADLEEIKKLGAKPAVVINPATPVKVIENVLDKVFLVLVMSVNPGFEKQAFMPEVLPKVEELAKLRKAKGLKFLIEIDGGINFETAPLAVKAGVDILVAGSAVYYSKDPQQTIKTLKAL
jgi:ribulose-phosphate 3-epimerase